MSTAWNLKELRDGVIRAELHDTKDTIEIINSIGRSCEIFDYHKCLARDAFQVFDVKNDPHGIEFARQLFDSNENQEALHQAKLESEANLIACISTTRNSYDSFGQLVNILAVATPLKGNFYVHDVARALPTGQLKTELSAAVSSNWFKYANAFMNTVKHRQLITHNASISFVNKNRGGKVRSFHHKGKPYQEYWAREVLEGTIELQNALVLCGRALNEAFLTNPTG
ncbi:MULTISPECIES: hypothetical protein [unclassified Pseudomonas]|uniref:hypothetical protein n=1 Tax=unclassified Pseudomonas TaxID=196821 RepID=UPI00339B1BF8